MFREKDWKIVNTNDEGWALYNVTEDLTEMNDLSSSHPEKVKELEKYLHDWEATLPGGKADF